MLRLRYQWIDLLLFQAVLCAKGFDLSCTLCFSRPFMSIPYLDSVALLESYRNLLKLSLCVCSFPCTTERCNVFRANQSEFYNLIFLISAKTEIKLHTRNINSFATIPALILSRQKCLRSTCTFLYVELTGQWLGRCQLSAR